MLPPGSLSFYFGSLFSESIANTADGAPTAGESAAPLVADPATDDNRWYAVTVGQAPGVYCGACVMFLYFTCFWDSNINIHRYHLSGNSTGTPGGTVQCFSDMHRALAAYQAAVMAGSVVEVTVATTRRVITPNDPVNIVEQ